jgi:RNA polymerase sigma-70 factor (ECF subfamily)
VPGIYATQSLDEVVEACKRARDADAWNEFLLRTHKLVAATVASTLRRWGRYKQMPLDDVVQDVYLKLSANGAAALRNFQAQHPNAVLGYLRAIAVSVASDYCKSALAAKRGAGRDSSLGDIDPAGSSQHAGGAENIERSILLQEIDQFLKQDGTSTRDRTIFWLYYRQGLAASSIAMIPELRLTTKGVESTILRLTRMLRAELGATRGGVTGNQLESPKDIATENSL